MTPVEPPEVAARLADARRIRDQAGPFLSMWTVYRYQWGETERFAVRRFDVVRGLSSPVPHETEWYADLPTLDQARAAMPERSLQQEQGGRTWASEWHRLPPSPEDDPSVVETWI
jgi:hypothetical protein